MSRVVAARTASAPDLAEEFEDIYRRYYTRVVQWVYWKLPNERTHQAEDYAQEAFRDLWEHLLKGRTVDYPWALLKKIAARRMADYYQNRKANAATDAVDFDEPSTASVAAVNGQRYASGDPEMSLLAGALWEAMERMREASERWRTLHCAAGRDRARSTMYRDPAKCAHWAAEADKAERLRDEALPEFQETCRVVGRLRTELEQLGGRDWKSSTGWPPPLQGGGGTRLRKSNIDDPGLTECPNGHPLRIDTVGFLEDGTRVCRGCGTDARHRAESKRKAIAAALK